MKNTNSRIFWYIVTTAGGIALIALCAADILGEFYAGLGGGFMGIGIIRLTQLFRYQHDEKYAKKLDMQYKDERNVYLSQKAKSYTFSYGLLTCAALSVILRIAGANEISTVLGLTVAGLVAVYLIIYFILQKKY